MQQIYGDSPHDPSPHHAEPMKAVASATTTFTVVVLTHTHMLANYMPMNISPQYNYIWGGGKNKFYTGSHTRFSGHGLTTFFSLLNMYMENIYTHQPLGTSCYYHDWASF